MIDMQTGPDWLLWMLAAANFGLCSMIAWSCVCRIALMSAETTRVRFRAGYSIMLVAASSSGCSPVLWGEWPGPGQISMALAVLYVMGVGYGYWRDGPPDYALRPDWLAAHPRMAAAR